MRFCPPDPGTSPAKFYAITRPDPGTPDRFPPPTVELELRAVELTDKEIIALSTEERAAALAELGCDADEHGIYQIVDPRERERRTGMAKMSISNGLSFVDAGDLTRDEAQRAAEIASELGGELAERVHIEMAPCEPHEYVERFAEAHESEHGEPWVAW